MTTPAFPSYAGHRFPAEFISHAVWLYFRFPLSLRMVEEMLAARGIMPTIADARFAKPLDEDMILRLAREHEALITIEEGAVGGFGSHVAQLLLDRGALDRGLRLRSMVLPDTFIDHASPEAMYAAAAMNAPHIEAKVLELLGVARIERRA